MRRTVALILLAGFTTAATFGQTASEDSVAWPPETRWRAEFREATDNQAQIDFLELMSAETDTASVLAQTYLVVGHILVGAHRRNVFSKWRSFRKWTSALNTQIVRAPENPELRFLRVMVQSNAPGFLGYSRDLTSDCQMVRSALRQDYWVSDSAHEEFVRTNINRIPKCKLDQ
jgi:hypothetical protein